MIYITLLRRPLLLASLILLTHTILAQTPTTLPFTEVQLNDMSAFKKAAGNWQIAGEVNCDRNKNEEIKTRPGKGILVNIPTKENKDNLFTSLEHGDIELEIDFMMAKGSNSGIYLQGLYELQLYDSWGTKDPIYQDCGGIYKRRDLSNPNRERLYEGKAPRVNVSKAPGLWQHFKIIFHAPRFNKAGKKIADAKFVRVEQNGVPIHENVELSGPTGGAFFAEERKSGPIVIQGDHGPVAFRNIKYKLYEQNAIKFDKIEMSYYEGPFQSTAELDKATPKSVVLLDDFVPMPKEHEGDFGVKLSGTVIISKTGNYLFNSFLGWVIHDDWLEGKKSGALTFKIGDKIIINNDGTDKDVTTQVQLQEGTYPFSFSYFQYKFYWIYDLALTTEGPGIPFYSLIPEKYNTSPLVQDPVLINPQKDPIVLRSFVNHGGKKKTLCVSVGDPGAIHYTLDLKQGALIRVWKSDFADLTPMWHERGEDQLSLPTGSVIDLSGAPSISILKSEAESWPDSASSNQYIDFKKYQMDKNGRPIFYYNIGKDVSITDNILPQDNDKALIREINVTSTQKHADLYCRVALGKNIEKLADGSYSINDKEYYISLGDISKSKPVIRSINNNQELLIPLNRESNQSKVVYSIIW